MKPSLAHPTNRVIEVLLANDAESIKIPLEEKEILVEDACTLIAIKLGISPLCRHLFALKPVKDGEWLPLHVPLQECPANVFVYRLRYKVPSVKRLRELDLYAFDYYFHQARTDVLKKNVRNLDYEVNVSVILGLVVADMLRVMLEENSTIKDVISRYKTYVPKAILKKHPIYSRHLKTVLTDAFDRAARVGQRDVIFVKEEYLRHLEKHAPEYLAEEFTAQVDDNGLRFVNILVNPFHPEMPGLQVKNIGKNEWRHLCTIDDLCFVSIRGDGTIEICRKNGIPINYCFASTDIMHSFVSLLDAYYRLAVKWTFNLSKEIFTPSLARLHLIKCHGPVGGHFAYAKLQEKRDNKPGCFILRECEKCHNVLYVDVCLSNALKPLTYRVQVSPGGSCLFSYDSKTYGSMAELVATFRSSTTELQLLECIPPTETDKSQALICSVETWATKLAAVTNPEEMLLSASPQCVNVQTLQIFPGSKLESRSGKTLHYRGMWKHNKRSRVKVAVKELKPQLREKYLGEFLELSGRWACLQSNSIVKLYGVTLAGKISMITEYSELGPLDVYLSNNKDVETVDLVEAAASLAMALWQMEEAGMTHGYIRCRKALVASRTPTCFNIKLCDPGLHTYNDQDIPWIPPECHKNMARAKMLTTADVWAFGTTLWEIFSYGKAPSEYEASYFMNGQRLQAPVGCPRDIYMVMRECWDSDVFKRKRPQAIMRDVYHILYQVFNSRRVHSYQETYPKLFPAEDSHSVTESGVSDRSDSTNETMLPPDGLMDELVPISVSDCDGSFSDFSISSDSGQIILFPDTGPYSIQGRPDGGNMPLNMRPSYNHFMEETIHQLGHDCNVILQGSIGQGHYGQVFRGVLERPDHEPQQVAVKKLKRDALSTTLEDFEREIRIMQELKHENIVTIIGEIKGELSLVMEFIKFGSLHGYLRMHQLSITPFQLLKFAEDVAKGMDYLGLRKVVHRDLAARNILVSSENHVKISDFGLAQFVDASNDDYYMLRTCREIPIKWYAPESLRGGRFSPRSDVWSYGVTLYEMFSFGEDPQLEGEPDELGLEGQYNALKNNCRLSCPVTVGAQDVYRTIMAPCWQFESKNRPTFSAIVKTIDKLRKELFYLDDKVTEIG